VLRVLVALACMLFVVSMFYPFLSVKTFSWVPEIDYRTLMFWSFQLTDKYVSRPGFFWGWIETVKLIDYWTYMRLDLGGVWMGLMILMFMAQLLTVLSAIRVILLPNRESFWFLLPGIQSTVTVVCMLLFAAEIKTVPSLGMNLEPGFWLAVISSALLLTGFVVSGKNL
jgi:hypothetical protein